MSRSSRFFAKAASMFCGLVIAFTVTSTTHAQSIAELQAMIAQLTAQIAALQSQVVGLQETSPAICSTLFTRDLALGSVGQDVTCLQKALTKYGYPVDGGAKPEYFGSETKTALSAWQAANGIAPASGYFGPVSRAKMNALLAQQVPQTSLPSVSFTTFAGKEPLWKIGDKITLKWSTSGDVPAVDVFFRQGDSSTMLASPYKNTGSFTWTVGDVKGGLNGNRYVMWVCPNTKGGVKDAQCSSFDFQVGSQTSSVASISYVVAKAGVKNEIYPGEIISIFGNNFPQEYVVAIVGDGFDKSTSVYLEKDIPYISSTRIDFRAPTFAAGLPETWFLSLENGKEWASNRIPVRVIIPKNTPPSVPASALDVKSGAENQSRAQAIYADWQKNPGSYTETTPSPLTSSSPVNTLLRLVRECSDHRIISKQAILFQGNDYGAYVSGSQYQAQCINDGTFDRYYDQARVEGGSGEVVSMGETTQMAGALEALKAALSALSAKLR